MRTDNTYIIGWLAAVLLLLTACNGDNQQPDVMSADLLAVGSAIEVSGGASKDTIQVEANCNWTVTTQNSWIHIINPKDGQGSGTQDLVLDIDASPLATERTSKLTIRSTDGIEHIVTVTQRAGDAIIDMDTTEVFFKFSGGEKTINIKSNVQWTATCDESWLKVSIDSEKWDSEVTANGDPKPFDQKLYLHADANNSVEQLEGTITFRAQDGNRTSKVRVTVGSREPNMRILPPNDTIQIPALGNRVDTFYVNCNYDWEATATMADGGEWFHFTEGNPSYHYRGQANNNYFSLSWFLDPNPSLLKRTAKVTFSIGNKDYATRIVIQDVGTLPNIVNVKCRDITHTSATISFQQSYDTFEIKECGVRYSTDESNVQNGKDEKGTVQDKPEINLKDLSPNTVYYVCAYATNAVGTRYSNVVSFQTRSVPGRDDHGDPDIE